MNVTAQINIITNNCEISEPTHQQLASDIENEVKRFPDHSQIKLVISKASDLNWTFDLSMRYERGHVATTKRATSLTEAISQGLIAFKTDLRTHELQWAIETFHFDKSGEYDFYTEVSSGILPLQPRKLSALIVEDDPAALVVLSETLKAMGCEVSQFDLPNEALESLATKRYDLIVLDWNLPYMKGGEFLTAADKFLQKADRPGKSQRQVPVVICTSMPLESLQIPDVTHFFVTNYWHKSLPFSSILGSVDDTTKKITVRNQIAI